MLHSASIIILYIKFVYFCNYFKVVQALSRVYSGVSAIQDFQFLGMRRYTKDDCLNIFCRIVEMSIMADTSKKLKNGENIDASIDTGAFKNLVELKIQ